MGQHDALERYFTGKQEDEERWKFLRKHLGIHRDGVGNYTYGLYGNVFEAIDDYSEFIRSKRVVYPFSGGRREQPIWVLNNFKTLDLLSEFFELDKKYGPQVVTNVPENPADVLLGKTFKQKKLSK